VRKLLCKLFGHKGPDNTITVFHEGDRFVYQCPRCRAVLNLKYFAGRLWINLN
jgi:Prophage protein (DUF1660)